MEAAFIFFVLNDTFGWTDGSEKCRSQFTKSYNKGWRIKIVGRNQLWFNFDKASKVLNVNNHVTAWFSTVNKRCFCVLLGLFFYILSENKLLCFLNVKTYAKLWWGMWWNIECALEMWNMNTKKTKELVKMYCRNLYRRGNFPSSPQRKKNWK